MRTKLCTIDQLYKDYLWPGGMMGASRDESIRNIALYEVLTKITEEDYHPLADLVETFTWFIPEVNCYGMVMPFFCTIYPEPDGAGLQLRPYSKVLYLSPDLEASAYDIALAVISHELAH